MEPASAGPTSPAGLSGTAASGRLAPAVQAPARGAAAGDDAAFASDDPALLDRMPVGILVYRYEELLFANRTSLAWTGYPDLAALRAAGGLEALFPDAGVGALAPSAARRATPRARHPRRRADARRSAGCSRSIGTVSPRSRRCSSRALRMSGSGPSKAAVGQAKALARELEALLDRVEDAVLVVDRAGAILSVHGGGKAFLGRGGRTLAGASFEILFAPDARAASGGATRRRSSATAAP